MTDTHYEGWCILELLGHRTRPGYVKEVEMAGGKMLRIDIPVAEDNHVTEFYGVAAIYSLRPSSEAIVRDAIERSYNGDPRPVRPVDYREQERIGHSRSADDLDDPDKPGF